jgi:hypothetical protein
MGLSQRMGHLAAGLGDHLRVLYCIRYVASAFGEGEQHLITHLRRRTRHEMILYWKMVVSNNKE